MNGGGPCKADIEAVLKKLRTIATNKVCFDCQAKNPTWASVTYGVFICLDCSAVHRSLGVHLSFVRSTQLDTNWTWLQLRNMQTGGNVNANTFFHQHNSTSTDAQQKYNSRAAQLYREKLNQLALQTMRLHGTNISIESTAQESQQEEKNDVDFFDEHSTMTSYILSNPLDAGATLSKNKTSNDDDSVGPSVDAALSISPTEAIKMSSRQPKRSTIGQRKPASKLGAKKGGLGAQRVKTDFAAIEKAVAHTDQLRQETKVSQPPSKEERQQQMQSLQNLQQAYENMGLASKKEEEKMKRIDPKKAEQAERLGMGLGIKTGVSHSAFGEMKMIEQETPAAKSSFGVKSTASTMRDSEIDDEFDTVILFSNGPPKYKDSPFIDDGIISFSNHKGSGIDDLLNSNSKPISNWVNDFDKVDKPPPTQFGSKVSASANYKFTPVNEHEAQQKFGNAKAISSSMFFNEQGPDSEMKTNLARFEGSSSISSSDLFGESQNTRSSVSSIQTPDLDDVRESVKQGVTKVAGRLSNMATNVMATIQDRYA